MFAPAVLFTKKSILVQCGQQCEWK